MARQTAVVGYLWLAWAASWFAAAVRSGRATKRVGALRQLGYQLPIALGALLMFGVSSRVAIWPLSTAVTRLLTAVVAIGLAFTWWARLHLGRLWSSAVGRMTDHHVVDTGPYAIVRHPIYTGLLLAIAATGADMATVPALAGAASMAVGLWMKASLEERFLRQELGADAYDRYARRVPMLVPIPRPRR
jgi:protein-S-isoprenylcysteine O-methyltransferase Ste14